mmetsp:Transcript_20209/g.49055  ORF Transcript_20209/g.49055 Transcript_20209/m.49055 type:complete len:96 (-) Transcript_20209:67-354(-)
MNQTIASVVSVSLPLLGRGGATTQHSIALPSFDDGLRPATPIYLRCRKRRLAINGVVLLRVVCRYRAEGAKRTDTPADINFSHFCHSLTACIHTH